MSDQTNHALIEMFRTEGWKQVLAIAEDSIFVCYQEALQALAARSNDDARDFRERAAAVEGLLGEIYSEAGLSIKMTHNLKFGEAELIEESPPEDERRDSGDLVRP